LWKEGVSRHSKTRELVLQKAKLFREGVTRTSLGGSGRPSADRGNGRSSRKKEASGRYLVSANIGNSMGTALKKNTQVVRKQTEVEYKQDPANRVCGGRPPAWVGRCGGEPGRCVADEEKENPKKITLGTTRPGK